MPLFPEGQPPSLAALPGVRREDTGYNNLN